MKIKKSEQLLVRAALWQARVDALKIEAAAAQVKEAENEKAQEMGLIFAIEAKARRALNDWSSQRIRERMKDVREAQRALVKLNLMDRARALDPLFNALRLRAEGFEHEQIEREVYGSASADKTHEELEKLVQARWDAHQLSI